MPLSGAYAGRVAVRSPAESTSPVEPEYRPALPDLIGRRPARIVVGVALVLAALLAAVGSYFVFVRKADDVNVVHRSAPVFNFRHSKVLRSVAPDPGGILRLESRRGSLFLQSYAVSALHLPRYRGAVSGLLPAFASRYRTALERRFDGFVALGEGRTRINAIPGYTLTFRARLGQRTLWGRDVLLVPDVPGAREGVVLRLLQTPAAGATTVDAVGAVGALKKPLRSFRFGTEAKGGE